MHSGLLNIWRENGAYLRYGDAKNVFVLGISMTALGVVFTHLSTNGEITWPFFGFRASDNIGWSEVLTLTAILLAFLFSSWGFLPALSKRQPTITAIFWIGKKIGIIPSTHNLKNVVYFVDVSAYENATAYQNALLELCNKESEWSCVEQDLIQQIWFVSRISAGKYITFYLSVYCLIFGMAISWL